MKVQGINGESYNVCDIIVVNDQNEESFIVKDWNWYWGKDKLSYLPVVEVEAFLSDSGSDFRDGYELGLLHGAVKKEKELIAEGIIEDDSYDEDEVTMKPRFEIYEGDE